MGYYSGDPLLQFSEAAKSVDGLIAKCAATVSVSHFKRVPAA